MGYETRGLRPQFTFLLFCYWVITLPIFALLYVMLPVSPDNALFDYMAWMRISGAHYYAGVAEQNWPGIVFIHELGIRFFGVHFWTYRLTDFFSLQIGCLGLFLFLKRCRFSLAPYVVLALYPPLYITAGIWMAGQRDIVAAQFLFLGTALLLVDANKSRFANLQLIAAGLIVAEAVLIRPTYLAYLPVLLTLRWMLSDHTLSSRPRSRRPQVFFTLGFFGLLSVVLLWSVSSRNLDDWYEQTIVFNLAVYATPIPWSDMLLQLVRWTVRSWHWLTLFAAFGFVLWTWRRGFWSEALYVAGISGTVLLSYFVQRKGFIYHVSGFLTIFTVLIAVLLDELQQRWISAQARKFVVIPFLAIVAVTIAGTASKLRLYQPMVSQISSGTIMPVDVGSEFIVTPEVLKVAAYIRDNSGPTDYILQWGRASHVGFLAQRQPSSRFISTPALNIIQPNNGRMQSWLDEFSTDLVQKKPVFVVLPSDLVKSQGGKLQPLEPPSKAFQTVLDLLSRGYTKVYEGNSLILMQAE